MTFGLLGEKLGHSYSKQLHQALFGYEYDLFPVASDKLSDFINGGQFQGLNVTIPYKKAVIPFCRTLSNQARNIGSVNTLIKMPDGSLHGDNTDYYGFLYMADKAGVSFKGKKVLILGSGGTSLTVKQAVKDSDAKEISIVSRTGEINYDNVYFTCQDAQIIVNTTPIGMFPNFEGMLLDLDRFPLLEGVLDAVYNPYRTNLLLYAKEKGLKYSGGLVMLVAQAKASAELFTGKTFPDSLISKGVRLILQDKLNIVLTGMPSAGKTTLGSKLAAALNKEFIDTDVLIEQSENMSVSDIFATKGEAYFRAKEADVIQSLAYKQGTVIATGGGSILNSSNRLSLARNGIIYHIERSLDKLQLDGRPLSKSIGALKEMYKIRQPLYIKFADRQVPNNDTIEQSLSILLEDYNETFGN